MCSGGRGAWGGVVESDVSAFWMESRGPGLYQVSEANLCVLQELVPLFSRGSGFVGFSGSSGLLVCSSVERRTASIRTFGFFMDM